MARGINKLSARTVEALCKPGRHSDGGNLYLSISPNGGKRWVFFYRFQNRQREMGLGSAAKGGVPLAKARELATAARLVLANGRDPLEARRTAQLAAKPIPTFGAFADGYLASHEGKWRNVKHRKQWRMTLDVYCQPIRSKPVDVIDTDDLLAVLQPIWQDKPETASRLRGRIEAVLDAAKAKGLRSADNPARWRGHLKALLPTRQRLTRGHHKALAYDKLPAFMADLRARQGYAAQALELAILTACRSGEVLGARWEEIDLGEALWTIPRERMKSSIEHRVPLCDRARGLLAELKELRGDHSPEWVFPGAKRGKPLSNMAMLKVLARMGRDDITPHGFRSAFRDWAAEQTGFPHTTAEHALAHRISDKAEAAYRRGDELKRRRRLMEAWAQWCEPRTGGRVVPMRRLP